MFSGIVEEFATVTGLVKEQENLHLTLTCSFVGELKIMNELEILKGRMVQNDEIFFRQKSPISSRKRLFPSCCTPKSVQQIA